jgi:hypothetical protein
MRPDGVTFEWTDISPETIPEVLLTYAPVCWNCHVATSFRRRYEASEAQDSALGQALGIDSAKSVMK